MRQSHARILTSWELHGLVALAPSPTTPTTCVRFASLAMQQRAKHPEHLILQGSLRLVLAACLARLESRYAEVPGQ